MGKQLLKIADLPVSQAEPKSSENLIWPFGHNAARVHSTYGVIGPLDVTKIDCIGDTWLIV